MDMGQHCSLLLLDAGGRQITNSQSFTLTTLLSFGRRWGASEFASTAGLDNTVGGSGAARYQKQTTHWRDEVLTRAVAGLEEWLGSRLESPHHVLSEPTLESPHVLPAPAARRVRCLNVVVPSFRCHVPTLRDLAALSVSGGQASVHILIVVDDPSSASLEAVKALEDWSPGHLVRVYVQPENSEWSLEPLQSLKIHVLSALTHSQAHIPTSPDTIPLHTSPGTASSQWVLQS